MQADCFGNITYQFDNNNNPSSIDFKLVDTFDESKPAEKMYPRLAMEGALNILSIAREQNISLSAMKRKGYLNCRTHSKHFIKVFSMAARIERDLYSARLKRMSA